MSQSPILPKTFAGYIHPLRSRYTEGSDQKTGMSTSEAKRAKVDVAISPVLNKAQKAEASALVDKAQQMTQTALKDGVIDAKEKQALLNLGKHDIGFQPLNQGKAAPTIDFAGKKLDHSKLQTRLFRVAAATSYAPKNNAMEGGTKDSIGNPLAPHTLDRYVAAMKNGDASANKYVAIAMDPALYKGGNAPMKYGDVFRMPEIEKVYGVAPIYFALVDNGGAFKNTDGGKVDICCNKSYTSNVNQTVSIHQVFKPDGQQLNAKDLD